MGRPKLLLPWGQTSVLGHLISSWQAAGAEQVAVVCASDDPGVPAELDRLSFPPENRIYNPSADSGMFSSILCAAQWGRGQPALSHWVIALGDQPHLALGTLTQLLRFAQTHPGEVCQPTRSGKNRHPVVVPKSVFRDLAQSGCSDLREFLAHQRVAGFECEDPGLQLDIDRPEDYRQALALAGLTTQ